MGIPLLDHIIIDLSNFTFEKDIMVYINGECVDHIKVPFENISETVKDFCNKYNLKQIDLFGQNSDYLLKIKQDFYTKYFNNDINISIFER